MGNERRVFHTARRGQR